MLEYKYINSFPKNVVLNILSNFSLNGYRGMHFVNWSKLEIKLDKNTLIFFEIFEIEFLVIENGPLNVD